MNRIKAITSYNMNLALFRTKQDFTHSYKDQQISPKSQNIKMSIPTDN